MATSAKRASKPNPHSSVSNQPPEEAAAAKKAVASKPPEEGKGAKASKARADGTEAVEGFKLAPEMAQAMTEAYTAPELTGLRDIAEATYGPPPPQKETVHGPDDRVRINNTSVYPWRVHASLLITAADNSQWIGTAWFIGPHTLMTAGHCVNIRGSGVPGRDGWVRRIQVMPGRNAASLPYGSVTSTSFRSVTGWTTSASGNENYDYGAIIIPTNLGSTTGWFGFGVYSNADLVGTVGNISGYPGDKPSGQQWYDAHRIASVNSRKVFYDIDTAGGQSGSAVYRIINGARYAFAVHAYGGSTTNSGTRIITAVYNNMVAWKA
jgi:V8-like Glu-specific endopeptidase